MVKAYVVDAASTPFRTAPHLDGRWKRIVTDTEKGLVIGMGELEPGQRAPWHAHPEEEVFFLLEGQGVVRWRDGEQVQEAILTPGCAFYKAPHVEHEMENPGPKRFAGLFVKV